MKKLILASLVSAAVIIPAVSFADASTYAQGASSPFGVVNYINQPDPITVSVTPYSGKDGSGQKYQTETFTFNSGDINQPQHRLISNEQDIKSFYTCVQYSSSGNCFPVIHGDASAHQDGFTDTDTINNAGVKVYGNSKK